MKLFKNTAKMLVAAAATSVIALSAFVIPGYATAPIGNVTYTHGVTASAKQTYGKEVSTAYETNMAIDGYVRYETGPNAGYEVSYPGSWVSNIKSYTNTINVGSTKGSSLFSYFVNNTHQHTSTAWWNFDFR
jgi:hypothetical protein